MTLNQERELRDVVERRGWREDRAQLRDRVHDAAVAGGSVAREGYAPRGRYQRPRSEATVLHKSNGSTGFVRERVEARVLGVLAGVPVPVCGDCERRDAAALRERQSA